MYQIKKITAYLTKVNTLYFIMDNEINNEVTIISLDKMIYTQYMKYVTGFCNAQMKKEFLVLRKNS